MQTGPTIVNQVQQTIINQIGPFGSAGGGTSVLPTGRVQKLRHDGYEIEGTNTKTSETDITEASGFFNFTHDLPDQILGYNVKLAALVGGVHLQADQPGRGGPQIQSDNNSLFFGGSYALSQGQFYSVSSFIYFTGDTDSTLGGGLGSFKSDTDGWVSNSVMGYVFDVPSSSNLKFDLRGSWGKVRGNEDFSSTTNAAVINYDSRQSEVEFWQTSIAGMLFTVIEDDTGFTRPFIQVSYRRLFDYDNVSTTTVGGVTFNQSFDQAKDYGRIEMGFDRVTGNTTFGTSIYTEGSEDERYIGGRAGVAFKF